MKLVATLLVRDEADVVESTIKHHLAQGVDLIIAMDNGSVDGTVQILEKYAAAGAVELHHQPDQDYRQSEWVTFMARRAATEHGADWVVHVDADEFWVPKDRTRTLAEVLAEIPAEVGRVRAYRHDMEGFPWREHRPWRRRLRWRNLNTLSERGKPLRPKVCHRADASVTIVQGNHRADSDMLGPLSEDQPFEIYHVPRRSWEQFRGKIDNGGSAYAANPDLPQGMGWHWREDYARLQDGSLEKTYRDRCLSVPTLVRGLAKRTLVRDRWLEKELDRLDAN